MGSQNVGCIIIQIHITQNRTTSVDCQRMTLQVEGQPTGYSVPVSLNSQFTRIMLSSSDEITAISYQCGLVLKFSNE